jgi:hypothetical protein
VYSTRVKIILISNCQLSVQIRQYEATLDYQIARELQAKINPKKARQILSNWWAIEID